MITCYDYPSARIVAESMIDCVLVGDSVAMAVHGYPNTLMASIEMMELHTKAVARGLSKQFLVSDLPFLAHRGSMDQTVKQVKVLMQAGAMAVKIEGGDEKTCNTIRELVNSGIPVMGHIGLTPQSINQLGGFKIQGKSDDQVQVLINQALSLQDAGCFSIVIECVPSLAAQKITESLKIPTIGIGAGVHTDGQVLVWHDLLGLQDEFNPRFLKRYAEGKFFLLTAINQYAEEVKQCHFPTHEHSF